MSALEILRAELARRREEAERLMAYCNTAQQLFDLGEFSAITMMGYTWPETPGRWVSGRELTALANDAEKAARDAAKEAAAVTASDGRSF